MKRKASFVLAIIIVITSVIINKSLIVYAYQCDKDINFSYSGIIADDVLGNRDCTFSINHIRENRFSGHFYVQAAYFYGTLVFSVIDEDINISNGSISYGLETYTCSFTTSNDKNVEITVNPTNGTATGRIIESLVYTDFTLSGSVYKFYAPYFPYDEEDMKKCRTQGTVLCV